MKLYWSILTKKSPVFIESKSIWIGKDNRGTIRKCKIFSKGNI